MFDIVNAYFKNWARTVEKKMCIGGRMRPQLAD